MFVLFHSCLYSFVFIYYCLHFYNLRALIFRFYLYLFPYCFLFAYLLFTLFIFATFYLPFMYCFRSSNILPLFFLFRIHIFRLVPPHCHVTVISFCTSISFIYSTSFYPSLFNIAFIFLFSFVSPVTTFSLFLLPPFFSIFFFNFISDSCFLPSVCVFGRFTSCQQYAITLVSLSASNFYEYFFFMSFLHPLFYFCIPFQSFNFIPSICYCFLIFSHFSFIGFTKFYVSQSFSPPFLIVFLSFCSSFYLFIHPFIPLPFLLSNHFSILLSLSSSLSYLFIHPFFHLSFLPFNPSFFSIFSFIYSSIRSITHSAFLSTNFSFLLSLTSIHLSIPSLILPSFQPTFLLSFLLYLLIHLFLHSPFLPFNPFSFSPFPIILSFHLFISHSFTHPSFLSTHLPFLLSLSFPPRALALSHPFPLSRATPSHLPD